MQPAAAHLLGAIQRFVEQNKRNDSMKPAIEALQGVVSELQGAKPDAAESPGRLAAKVAAEAAAKDVEAREDPREEQKETEAEEKAEQPKTFADAHAQAAERLKDAA